MFLLFYIEKIFVSIFDREQRADFTLNVGIPFPDEGQGVKAPPLSKKPAATYSK